MLANVLNNMVGGAVGAFFDFAWYQWVALLGLVVVIAGYVIYRKRQV